MVRKKLNNEIEKWSEKLNQRVKKLKSKTKEGKWMLENIKAYQKDSKHFREEEMPVESFESLIWAWAFLEIGEELEHLERTD